MHYLNQHEFLTDLSPDHPELENELDPAVQACLPPDSTIIGAASHGASHWTRTARIDVKLPEGAEGGDEDNEKSFFLKIAEGENGKGMLRGECESMKAIYELSPEFVPEPLTWGTFENDDNTHFMLSAFREMDQEVPSMENTCERLADMHLRSLRKGETRFGFPLDTYNGSLRQINDWKDKWEPFFVQQLKGMLELEEHSQGHQPDEMSYLLQRIFEKVIPRLLRPMEYGHRRIYPVLVHGDFWHGNVSSDVEDSEPVTYDASAFWGHGEYDIRTMTRASRYKFGPAWQREYLKCFGGATWPEEDFEARSELYILRSKVHDSALFEKNSRFRTLLIDHARHLVDKYGEGFEAWEKRHVAEEGLEKLKIQH